MSFENIITAVLTSSLVGLVVGYILNRRQEAARQRLEEEIRRGAALHDDQTKLFCELLEMTYRMRNVAREFAGRHSANEHLQFSAKSVRRFEQFHDALTELLYKKRGVLPLLLFELAHDLKNHTTGLAQDLHEFQQRREHEDHAERVLFYFREIDAIYETMVPLVQAHVGIKDDRT